MQSAVRRTQVGGGAMAWSDEPRAHAARVGARLAVASRTLLEHLMGTHALMEKLSALKKYFLLQQVI